MRYVEKYGKPRQDIDIIIRGNRFASCVSKSTDTHSDYEILIAFPLQNFLRECASVFRLTEICLLF